MTWMGRQREKEFGERRDRRDEGKKSSHLVCCSVGNEEAISVACTI